MVQVEINLIPGAGFQLTPAYGALGFKVTRNRSFENFESIPDSLFTKESQNNSRSINLKVFPNPSIGLLNIESDIKITKAEIYSVDGNLITNIHVNANRYSSKIELSTGYYLIKLFTENNTVYTEK